MQFHPSFDPFTACFIGSQSPNASQGDFQKAGFFAPAAWVWVIDPMTASSTMTLDHGWLGLGHSGTPQTVACYRGRPHSPSPRCVQPFSPFSRKKTLVIEWLAKNIRKHPNTKTIWVHKRKRPAFLPANFGPKETYFVLIAHLRNRKKPPCIPTLHPGVRELEKT